MSHSIVPIGSVVRIGERLFVVVGHRMARDERIIAPCYLLVPYPLGFVSANSLSLTPASKVDEVVFGGYVSDASDTYLGEFASIANQSKDVAYDDYADAVLSFNNYLREEAETDE